MGRLLFCIILLFAAACNKDNDMDGNVGVAQLSPDADSNFILPIQEYTIPFDIVQKSFHIALKVKLGVDDGRPLGTLFELRRGPSVLASAGFQDVVGSAYKQNNRVLHYYVNLRTTDVTIKDVGNPYPSSYGDFKLMNYHDTLFAISSNGDLKFLFDDNWLPYSAPINSPLYSSRSIIPVEDGYLYSRGNSLYFDDILVGNFNNDLVVFDYWYGKLMIVLRDKQEDIISYQIYKWKKGESISSPIYEWKLPKYEREAGFPYAWIPLADEKFVVATNTGLLLEFNNDSMRVDYRRNIINTWQVYSMLKYRDKILFGQYPAGSIEFLYKSDVTKFYVENLPFDACLYSGHREAQSMAFYRGALYCGVWPWGQLYKMHENDYNWTMVARLFKFPEESKSDAPFVPYFYFMEDRYNNHWGQRIPQLAICNNRLYAMTSNKNSAFNPSDTTLMISPVLAQYGKIYEVHVPSHLCKQPRWKDVSVFEFGYSDGLTYMLQDGDTLTSEYSEVPFYYDSDKYELRLAQGPFGECFDRIEILNTPVN
jgi:hypothetical protein